MESVYEPLHFIFGTCYSRPCGIVHFWKLSEVKPKLLLNYHSKGTKDSRKVQLLYILYVVFVNKVFSRDCMLVIERRWQQKDVGDRKMY